MSGGLRRVRCSMELLQMVLAGKHNRECTSDFPANVEIVDVRVCDDDRTISHVFSIIVQSDIWEPLKEGQAIPFLDVTFETLPNIRTQEAA